MCIFSGIGNVTNLKNGTEVEIDMPPHPVVNIMWLFMYFWNFTWVLYTVILPLRKKSMGKCASLYIIYNCLFM